MKRIYGVVYELKWDYDSTWYEDKLSLLANGDARKAISIAESRAMKQSFVDEETGRRHKPVAFRLREVTIEAETSN